LNATGKYGGRSVYGPVGAIREEKGGDAQDLADEFSLGSVERNALDLEALSKAVVLDGRVEDLVESVEGCNPVMEVALGIGPFDERGKEPREFVLGTVGKEVDALLESRRLTNSQHGSQNGSGKGEGPARPRSWAGQP
jgi:hypothetical protein